MPPFRYKLCERPPQYDPVPVTLKVVSESCVTLAIGLPPVVKVVL